MHFWNHAGWLRIITDRKEKEDLPKKDRREMDGFLDIDDDDDEETAELSDKDWDNFFNDEAEGDE